MQKSLQIVTQLFCKETFLKKTKTKKTSASHKSIEDFEGVIYRFAVAQNWLRWKNPVFSSNCTLLSLQNEFKWTNAVANLKLLRYLMIQNTKFAFWHIKKFVLPHKISSNGVSTQAPSIRHHGELFGWGTLIGQCLTIGEASTHGTSISNGWY